RHLGDTDGGIHQDGSAGGRHDAVVGGGRHAHAQHDAAEHGQRQGDNHVAAGEADDCAQQLGGQARHRDAAGDNAGHAAGHRHSDGALGAALQGVDDLAEGEEVLPVAALAGDLHHVVDQAYGHGRHDCDGSGEGHGVHVGGDHDHQQHQGRQKVDLGQQLAHAGQLLSGNALQAQLLGLQMDGDVDAGEVQHRRQDGPHGDGAVGLAGELCHQEGCGAHDGGHDLAAGGGSRLHGAGELRLVARLLHHGDGDGAGGDGVAHGGAGHHSAQGGGDDGHLGGAAGGGTGHGIGQVDEELGDAGPLQEGAEDDEHHDELGAHADGAAEDAVEGVE
ncbi:site-specific DNA-methyltransferase (adenine-specific), partial [Dysosmobacter welbionis]